jgi:hypothetical protein
MKNRVYAWMSVGILALELYKPIYVRMLQIKVIHSIKMEKLSMLSLVSVLMLLIMQVMVQSRHSSVKTY